MDGLVKLLKEAVEKRIGLDIVYQEYRRIVSPYLLAKTDKGRYVLHALQTAGSSSKGHVVEPVWRFLYLDEIASVQRLSEAEWKGTLSKIDGQYVPPKFITEVLALAPQS